MKSGVWTRRARLAVVWGAPLLWGAIVVSVFVGGGTHLAGGRPLGLDFLAFYTAGKMVTHQDASQLYDFAAQQRWQATVISGWSGLVAFVNPPTLALWMAPWSLVPFYAAFAAWEAMTLGALVVAMKLLDVNPLAGTAAALASPPIIMTFTLGQNSVLSLLVVAITWRLVTRERLVAAGAVAALLVYKPHLLVGLVVWWLLDVKRCWPALLALAAAAVALSGACECLLPGTHAHYATLATTVLPTWPVWPPSTRLPVEVLSWRAFVWTLMPAARHAGQLASAACMAIGVAVFASQRSLWRTDRSIAFALAILLSLFCAPMLQSHDWALLAAPGAVLWAHRPQLRERLSVAYLALFLTIVLAEPLATWQVQALGFGVQLAMPMLAAMVAWLLIHLRRQARSFVKLSNGVAP